MAKTPTGPGQVERCFTIHDVLFKRIMTGMSNKEVADATGFTPVQVCRDLDLLFELGRIEKTPEGRWRPHHRSVGQAVSFLNQTEEYAKRGEEFKNRVNAFAARNT